jgi:hypothetical protein
MTTTFAKSNYFRKLKYRIITTITSKYVIKKALSSKSIPHLKKILKNEKIWQNYIGNLGKVIKGKLKNKSLIYDYYNKPNIKTELHNAFINKNYKKFNFLLRKCFNYLDKLPTIKLNNYSQKQLNQYKKIFNLEPDLKDKLIKIANIDLLPDNLIFTNKQVFHIDSEWVYNFPLEIGFLKTRLIFRLLQNLNPVLIKYPKSFSLISSNNIPCPSIWAVYIKKYTNEEVDNYIQKEINFQKYINRNYNFNFKDLFLNNPSVLETLKLELDISQSKLATVKSGLDTIQMELKKIKSSKTFKLWQKFCYIRKKLLTFFNINETN